MRAGNWPDRDVRHFDVVARFDGGEPVQVESMRLTHSMIDGHPSGHGGGMSTSGSITILRDKVASSITPDPWSRRDDFPPKSGTPVTIDVTDGEGQSWRRLTGITERAEGSFSSSAVTIPVRDAVDRLGAAVTSPPVLEVHPPLIDGGDYRRPRMGAEWLLDRAARQSGWFATPQMRWEAVMSAPMVGSAWPEHGTLSSCETTGGGAAPSAEWSTEWQALRDVSAIWDFTATTTIPELSMALHPQASGTSMRVQVVTAAGVGAYLLVDSGMLRYGTINGGTITEVGTLAHGDATRAALRVTTTSGGTMGLTVRTDTGLEATAAPAHYDFASLVFSRVRAYGAGVLGWVQVLNDPATRWVLLDPVAAPITARHRLGDTIEQWDAAPHVWDTHAIDLISDWARATCGQAWIDMDGHLQLASREAIDDTAASVLTLSSRDSLLDVDWEDDGMHVARQVRVTHNHPKIQRGRWASWRVWQGDSQSLRAGEELVATMEIPDDEDWIDLDATPHQVNTSTTRTDILQNTVIGGMQISDVMDESDIPALFASTSMTKDGDRAWEVRVVVRSDLPSDQSVITAIPDALMSIPRRYRGLPLPDVKARARVYRLERIIMVDTVPGDGATVQLYEHDAGWWTQNGDRRTLLHTYLRYQMGEQQPAPTGVSVAPDLRLELGDVVTVEDADRTGVRVVMLATQIDTDFSAGSGLSMTVGGRELGWADVASLEPTDTGHTPTWTMEAT